MKNSRAASSLDKIGAVGAVLAAAAAPCCFPLLAAVGTVLGLSILQPWRGYMDYAIQTFALISVGGSVFAFRQHRRMWPLSIGLAGTAALFFAFYADYHVTLIYLGLAGLGVAAVGNIVAKRRAWCSRVELQSVITCPHCGHQKSETMPTDACMHFYECESCHAMLKPKPGDCCVYCSYGSVKCPPIQSGMCYHAS